jgi:SAM-dependent methyltransferase
MLQAPLSSYREWKSWEREAFLTSSEIDRVYFSAELRRCGIRLAPGMSVLEIGFGNGSFASYCREIGVNYTGTELDPQLVREAREANVRAFEADQDIASIFEPRSIDLVVAWDVFEHIDHDALVALLSDLRGVLSEDGFIVARFPSGDSPFAGVLYNGDGTHRTLIGIGKLDQICKSSGLRVLRNHAQTIPLRGHGLLHLCRKLPVIAARRLIARAISFVFLGGGKYVIEPNMVAVLAAGESGQLPEIRASMSEQLL